MSSPSSFLSLKRGFEIIPLVSTVSTVSIAKLTPSLSPVCLNTKNFADHINQQNTSLSPAINSRFVRRLDFINTEEIIREEEEEKHPVELQELGQRLENMRNEAEFVSNKIEDFSNDIQNFEEEYRAWRTDFSEYSRFQGNILSALEYFNVNHDNFQEALSKFLSPEQYRLVGENLKSLDGTSKWTACIALLVFNVAKYCINNQVQSDLERLQKRFQDLKNEASLVPLRETHSSSFKKLQDIQLFMDQLNRKLAHDKGEAFEKSLTKLEKLAGKITAVPLERVGVFPKKAAKTFNIFHQLREFFALRKVCDKQREWVFHLQSRIFVNHCVSSSTSQDQLYHEVENFLNSLSNCASLKEVKKQFNKIGIKTEIPENFEEWQQQFKSQRFKRHLVQSYYYCIGRRPFMDESCINSILRKRGAAQADKVKKKLKTVKDHIVNCKNLEVDEIKNYFNELHIHLDQIYIPVNEMLRLPIQTKEDWNQCIQSEEFLICLARQSVEYQETTAQLAMQALRQALLSKNSVEQEFLRFRTAEYIAKIAFSIVQLVLCLPTIKLWLAASALELFVTDIAKLGIPSLGLVYIFHPLYPDISFKLDDLVLKIAEHFFAVKYKPNEYSLEGYQFMIQMRWLGLVENTHYLISLYEQALLWLNMRLVENCIMGLEKKPFENDNRYIQINEKYEQHRLTCKQEIRKLEDQLKNLMLQDAKLGLRHQIKNYQMQNAGLNFEIENLSQALEQADFELFPIEVLDFFEENLGFMLNEKNKARLKVYLQTFFSADENTFLESYRTNLWYYYRT
jgi:hypothetical protein